MFNLRVLEIHSPAQLAAEIRRLGVEARLEGEWLDRATLHVVKLEGVDLKLARLLYQELTMEDGQVILPPRLEHVAAGETDLLLCATRYQFSHLAVRLRWQPSEELQALANALEEALDRQARRVAPPPLAIGPRTFEWGARTYVMGILNATPDSFSGDALGAQGDPARVVERGLEQARRFLDEGADILDVGGESTRPGSTPVSSEEELARVLPVVRALAREIQAPISIDTYKAEVARAALEAGAHLVNDVWGLRMDPEMKRVVAAARVPVVLMHNRSKPKNVEQSERLGGRYTGIHYDDLLGEVMRELGEQVEVALAAGIAPERILLDPGLGFGKTVEQNLELLDRVGELKALGFPVLIGPSRKGFIGFTQNLPVSERVEGTAAAVAVGIVRGADIVRVHDVKAMTRVARMTDALVRRNAADHAQP